MKLYKVKQGALIEYEEQFYLLSDFDWDGLINDDQLFQTVKGYIQSLKGIKHAAEIIRKDILAPIQNQELWACGVTYFKSKTGRQEESKATGGADFYTRVYEAERPEVFFKATPHRVVGHGAKVNIRKDSTWDVPEPELTLVVTSSARIVGYTIGNDMSSRSIEGENPLYLPQAKTYDACAAVGPCIYITEEPLSPDTGIYLTIRRKGETVFNGQSSISLLKRTLEELVSFVYKECSFPYGCLVMTGTGIVPSHDFTLHSGDEIEISIDHIGTLVNTVR